MTTLITNVTVAGIFSEPNFQSEMISQSLLWEKLDILDKNENWYKVRQFDNYEGWINNFYVIQNNFNKSKSATYIETNPLGRIYSTPDLTSIPLLNCTFGTILPAIETKEVDKYWWHKIILPNQNHGWIQDNGYEKSNSIRETIKKTALEFLGTPYVWGGRSSYGFDCSGFIQTIFKFCGIFLPRDSKDQFLIQELIQNNIKDNKVGDLLFFAENDKINHIAISFGESQFIHSSGFVKINSLDQSDNSFDEKLFKMYHQSMSIKNLL